MKRPVKFNFAKALRHTRKARGLTQEDFDGVSSRVHVSRLERDDKGPTLMKVNQLANVLEIHPLTLLALSYCDKFTADEVKHLFERIVDEVDSLASAA